MKRVPPPAKPPNPYKEGTKKFLVAQRLLVGGGTRRTPREHPRGNGKSPEEVAAIVKEAMRRTVEIEIFVSIQS